MKWNQIKGSVQQENLQPLSQPRKKRRLHGKAFGFVSCLLIAGILFGTFYTIEYGLPFEQTVYAAAAESATASSLLLNQVNTAAAADAAENADTETVSASASAAVSANETETDSTYESDNLEITVSQYSSGSGSSKITWYVADIEVTDLSLFTACFADDTYGQGITDTVLDMARNNDAVLAVNGDYYSQQKNNIVIRNGELYQEADTSSDLCVLYKDGTMATYSPGEMTASAAIENGAWQAWNFGPALLADDGSALISFNTSDRIASKNPRTAIGYYEPGHYCLVVVDGRSSGYSCGMTLDELSQLFSDLGCTQAYNLDGGKSSVMVFNGAVVNQAADGGREVSDAILLG